MSGYPQIHWHDWIYAVFGYPALMRTGPVKPDAILNKQVLVERTVRIKSEYPVRVQTHYPPMDLG